MGASTWVSLLTEEALRIFREKLERGEIVDRINVVRQVFVAHQVSPGSQAWNNLYDDVVEEVRGQESDLRIAVEARIHVPCPRHWSDTDKD